MADTTLIQERFVKRFEFQLEPDAIAVTEQDGPTKRSYRVPLESLAAQVMGAFIATVQERRRQYLAEHYLLGTHEPAQSSQPP